MTDKDIETRLSAARTRLIIEKPFLGALVLRLPMIAASPEWCKTTATDARAFYYNPEYIGALDLNQTQFILAHEALHCALSHFARRGTRDKHRWDVACDFAINPILIEDGLTPPPGALYEKSFEGMTADEIYPCIDENPKEEPLDQHLYDQERDNQGRSNQSGGGKGKRPKDNRPQEGKQDDRDRQPDQPDNEREDQPPPQQDGTDPQQPDQQKGQQPGDTNGDRPQGAGQPEPLSPAERDQLRVQWQQRLAGAAQQAMQAGKLGVGMARMIDFLLEPELPWRVLLARYLTSVARDDYNYTRPSTRRGDPAVFPSLRSAQVDMVVIVDVSGSVSEKEISQFVAEIDTIKGQIRARIVFHACDADLVGEGPWEFEPWEEFTMPTQIQGGGGTSFRPPFEWVEQRDRAPDLLVYFTDAEGDFPDYPPNYPVIWLIKGKGRVPWGERIQLN
ncbi:MAG TPA: hypothetical protein ENJ01_11625 [Gammaproteobacteria bacterium]|nr:hypothetical protein [Gammaproteobacteria bacterium]